MIAAGVVIAVLIASSVGSAPEGRTNPAARQKPAAPAQLPSVEQILDRYVKALGGKAALEKINSISARGTFSAVEAGQTGTVETYKKGPDKSVSIVEVNGYGTILQGFDGKIGWSEDPQSGVRELSGVELAQTKRDSDIRKDLHIKQQYAKIDVTGTAKVGDLDTYVVEAAPPEGGLEKLYFDKETGLLDRVDMVLKSPLGEAPVQNYLEDYREVDGVKFAFRQRQVAGGLTYIATFTDVKDNVPIDDAKFSKPASQ